MTRPLYWSYGILKPNSSGFILIILVLKIPKDLLIGGLLLVQHVMEVLVTQWAWRRCWQIDIKIERCFGSRKIDNGHVLWTFLGEKERQRPCLSSGKGWFAKTTEMIFIYIYHIYIYIYIHSCGENMIFWSNCQGNSNILGRQKSGQELIFSLDSNRHVLCRGISHNLS
jgi:hypothetical protein